MPPSYTLRRAARKAIRPIWQRLARGAFKPGQANHLLNAEIGRVLAIIAHPDDEVFCSGLLCEFADRGADVGIVCLTGGNAEAEGEERERRGELVAAAAELGIAEVRFLDYPDPPAGETGRLFAPEIDSILLVAELRSVLTQPRETDLVITHGSGGEYWHPAHVLLHDHVLRAAKSLTHCPFLATFNAWSADNPLPQVSNRDDIANFSIDVRAYHARRLASLQRHATQRAALESLVGFGIDQLIEQTAIEFYRVQTL